MITKILTVLMSHETKNIVKELVENGYSRDNIYILVHDDQASEALAESTEVDTILNTMPEENLISRKIKGVLSGNKDILDNV